MVSPSIESMSHSNDDKNKSDDDNISEIILHQKDSKYTFLICIYSSPLEAFT